MATGHELGIDFWWEAKNREEPGRDGAQIVFPEVGPRFRRDQRLTSNMWER